MMWTAVCAVLWGNFSYKISKIHLFGVLTAIDLITNLLQVKLRKRFTVDKCLLHVFLQVRGWDISHS